MPSSPLHLHHPNDNNNNDNNNNYNNNDDDVLSRQQVRDDDPLLRLNSSNSVPAEESNSSTDNIYRPRRFPSLSRGYYHQQQQHQRLHTSRTIQQQQQQHLSSIALTQSTVPPQRHEGEMMMDEVSDAGNWIDMNDGNTEAVNGDTTTTTTTSSTTSSTNPEVRHHCRSTTTTSSSSRRNNDNNNNNTIKLQIPSIVCDVISSFWEWSTAAVEIWMDVLTAPPLPPEALQRVAIILLGVEMIRDSIDHSALLTLMQQQKLIITNHSSGATAAAVGGGGGELTIVNVPHYMIWGIPVSIAALSASFVFALQFIWGQQEEAVIATALILLIFLEAMLPVCIVGLSSLFIFQQVSLEMGLGVLVAVWLGSTLCAGCIRRMLYQSLGHG